MLCRETLGGPAEGPASVPGHFLTTPITLSLLSASLLYVPRAFLSTPVAFSASLMGGDLSAMSRDGRGVPRVSSGSF